MTTETSVPPMMRKPQLFTFAILVSLEIVYRPTCQAEIHCEPGLQPMPLGLDRCTPLNCNGKCMALSNSEGLFFDLCCVDLTNYTCYNSSSLKDLRDACFNTSSENDTTCESFESNVRCAANFYGEDFNVCLGQYKDLYAMQLFKTRYNFEPKNCPCETGYIKVNEKCPCANGSDACGVSMSDEDVCCFKTEYLRGTIPCSKSERFEFGTCSASTCRGRCVDVTVGAEKGRQVCCISPEDLKEDDTSQKRTDKTSPTGAIVGSVVAVLVIGVVIGVFSFMYLRSKEKCIFNKRKESKESEQIQMETRQNGTFSDISKDE